MIFRLFSIPFAALMIGLFSFLATPVLADEEESEVKEVTTESSKPSERCLDPDKLSERMDEVCESYILDHRRRKFPLIFRDNYFVYTHTSSFDDGRKKGEIKFRLSFQTPVLPVLKTESFTFVAGFAYSQRSFWQITDEDNSRPFRETNYNPEGFIYIETNDKMFSIRMSPWEHESNGREEGLNTRSWDRFYAEPGFNWNNQFVTSLKIWGRYPEKECEEGGLSKECDENPDLEDYTGNYELRVKYQAPSFTILNTLSNFEFTMMQRRNFSTNKGAVELGVAWKIFEVRLYLQYWNGYAESLIDYKTEVERWGIGAMLVR